jgi:hypothetical protein
LSVAGTEVWGFAVRVWIYGNGNCENAPGRTLQARVLVLVFPRSQLDWASIASRYVAVR